MRRRPAGSWREHLEREARRRLHCARLALRYREPVLALELLALACESLEALAECEAGAA